MKIFIIENLNIISIIASILIIFLPYFLRKLGAKKCGSLALTFGILGTFAGVTIGLLNFNENEIQKSIPTLLDGLKASFFTSLAGLLTKIIIESKIFNIYKIYGFQEQDNQQELNIGQEIVKELKETKNQNKEILEKLLTTISGDGDSTVTTQMEKIRLVNKEGFEKIEKSFNDFAQKVAENNSKALIEALEKVIADFNTKINEQFGENFKQLNDAVGKMLEWQKNYKEQVEKLVSQIQGIYNSIKGIDENLENTAKSHERIYRANEELQKLIMDFSAQVNSFAELGEKAKESFPVIQKNMENLTTTATQHVEENLKRIEEKNKNYEEQQQEIFNQFTETAEKNFNDFKNTQEEVKENFKEIAEKQKGNILEQLEGIKQQNNSFQQEQQKTYQEFSKTAEDYREAQNNHITEELKKVEKQNRNFENQQEQIFNKSKIQLEGLANDNKKRMIALDEQLGSELTKALQKLSDQLVSLSNKFVADYTPLTEQLQKVVKIAEKL